VIRRTGGRVRRQNLRRTSLGIAGIAARVQIWKAADDGEPAIGRDNSSPPREGFDRRPSVKSDERVRLGVALLREGKWLRE